MVHEKIMCEKVLVTEGVASTMNIERFPQVFFIKSWPSCCNRLTIRIWLLAISICNDFHKARNGRFGSEHLMWERCYLMIVVLKLYSCLLYCFQDLKWVAMQFRDFQLVLLSMSTVERWFKRRFKMPLFKPFTKAPSWHLLENTLTAQGFRSQSKFLAQINDLTQFG